MILTTCMGGEGFRRAAGELLAQLIYIEKPVSEKSGGREGCSGKRNTSLGQLTAL